jgi:putative component of membrane protein insertase Oxa1/YidC/SpoIIIJ protein YidD
MAIPLRFAILFCFFLAFTAARAQSAADVKAVAGLMQVQNNSGPGYEHQHKDFPTLLFRFYKNWVSSQNDNVCTFYPSCSNYTMQCLHQKGIMIAILAGFDRLARCNGLSPENYSRYKNTVYLYDPVR